MIASLFHQYFISPAVVTRYSFRRRRNLAAVLFAFSVVPVVRVGALLSCNLLTQQNLGLGLSSPPRRWNTNLGNTNLGDGSSSRRNSSGRSRNTNGRSTPSRSDDDYYYDKDYVDGGDSYGQRRTGRNGRNNNENDDYDYSSGGNRNYGRTRSYGNNDDGTSNYNQKGRQRYSSDGRKRPKNPTTRGQKGGELQEQRERPPTPPLDSRPTYFTCRHTYEKCLRDEIVRSLEDASMDTTKVSLSRPHPGLVMAMTDEKSIASFLECLRPSYAIQVLPDCAVVNAESIKGLANQIMGSLLLMPSGVQQDDSSKQDAFLLRPELVTAPKGSLAIHSLVPEMGRGMPESQLPQYRRATKIGEEIAGQLKKRCKAARAIKIEDDDDDTEQWLLQILLLEPKIVAASFVRCRSQEHDETQTQQETTPATPHWTWPNWRLPAGLALVDIEDEQKESSTRIPSSAYRKLLEAFWYLGERPPAGGEFPVVDLGACPGGWTGALRLMGCDVIAVDRSPLDKSLARDPNVEFVKGDAFRFVPPWARGPDDGSWKALDHPLPNTWMVSDIIAYPDKITQLLDDWCGRSWISHAIVTIKFQSDIPWEDVENATAIVKGHGYSCRTVHFFNNKNELTFLAVKDGYSNNSSRDSDNHHQSNILLGKPMYSPILPAQKKKK